MDELDPYEIARLIEGHINKKLTDLEESRFQQLLSKDGRVQRLLNEYKNSEALNKRLTFLNSIDVDAALLKVKTRATQPIRRLGVLPTFLKYAAVLLVGVAGLLWYYNYNTAKQQLPQVAKTTPKQQDNKSSLTLSDGQVVYLEKDAETIKETDGTEISVLQNTITYGSADGANATAQNVLNVPTGKTYRVNLADGTVVWLNNLSELSFPVSFNGQERTVSLKGEAYFEVAHNAAKPFKVNVNGTAITVLGTKFNVNGFYKKSTAIVLLEGSVKVENKNTSRLLKPGLQAISDSGNISINTADLRKTMAWKNGDFLFKEDNIETILGQLSRWYNVDVKYTAEISEQLHYSGKISRSEKLDEVLVMLTDITGFKFKLTGSTLLVDNK